jgi:hypothetical protein
MGPNHSGACAVAAARCLRCPAPECPYCAALTHTARVSGGRIRAVNVDRQSRAISHGDTDVALLDHRFVSARFRGADHRRNSAPVSTNRHPHRSVDYATFLYDRKV